MSPVHAADPNHEQAGLQWMCASALRANGSRLYATNRGRPADSGHRTACLGPDTTRDRLRVKPPGAIGGPYQRTGQHPGEAARRCQSGRNRNGACTVHRRSGRWPHGLPALKDVRARSLPAHGMHALAADRGLELRVLRACLGAGLDPGWLALDRRKGVAHFQTQQSAAIMRGRLCAPAYSGPGVGRAVSHAESLCYVFHRIRRLFHPCRKCGVARIDCWLLSISKPGRRFRSAVSATLPSRRAKGAPRQVWMPVPKEKC